PEGASHESSKHGPTVVAGPMVLEACLALQRLDAYDVAGQTHDELQDQRPRWLGHHAAGPGPPARGCQPRTRRRPEDDSHLRAGSRSGSRLFPTLRTFSGSKWVRPRP